MCAFSRFRALITLATVVTVSVTAMTLRESQIGTSGAQEKPLSIALREIAEGLIKAEPAESS